MKRRQVLILHHVEPMWAESIASVGGITFDELQRRAVNHIRHVEYDHVIVTRLENNDLDDEEYHPEFKVRVSTVHEYGYGWPAQALTDCPKHFVQGGSHSEAVLVPQWMKKLTKFKVFVGGCFDGECLDDLMVALRSQKIAPRRVSHLIV